jgi:hypothetical protein
MNILIQLEIFAKRPDMFELGSGQIRQTSMEPDLGTGYVRYRDVVANESG